MEITPGWETVIVTVDPSGFVEARIGSSPHGQGLRTTLAQIIADEIGVDAATSSRSCTATPTRTPYGWGTFASRSLVISGGATLIAARKVRAKLIKIASHMLEAAPDDIVLEDGAAKVAGTDRADHDRQNGARGLHADAQLQGRDRAGPDRDRHLRSARHLLQRLPRRASSRSTSRPGASTIEKFLVAEDAGRIINPMIADGQVHGGIAQGIGNALLEEIIYDENGGILTATLADYMPPTAHEIPPIELHHLETPSTTFDHQGQGPGRRRRHRRAGGGDQRHQRRAVAVRRRDRRNAGDAAAHPRGAAREGKSRMSDEDRPSRSTINGRDHADRGRAAAHAGRRHPRGLRADRHPYRLRARHLRRLHRDRRRRAGALVPDVRRAGGRQEDPHRRRPGRWRHAAPDAAGLHGPSRPAMRLLHAGLSDAGGRRAGARAQYQRRRSARRAVVQSLPLHRLSEHHQGRARGGEGDARANDGAGQIRRPLRPASGRPPAAARPRPLRRRHFVSRPMAHARGALARRARQDQSDRRQRRAGAARRARGVDACRRRAHSADRIPAHRPDRAWSPTGSRRWPRTPCAMSASRWRRCSPTIPISPKTPPIWSSSISSRCRSSSMPPAPPGPFDGERSTEATVIEKKSGDIDAAFRAARPHRRARSRRSDATAACRWKRAAPSPATTKPTTFWKCTAPPRCRTGTATAWR